VFKISTDLFQVRHGSLSLQTNTRKNKQTRKCKQTVPNVFSYKKKRTKRILEKVFQKISTNSRKLQEILEKFQKIPGKFLENFKKFQKIPKKVLEKILETSWKHPGKKS